MHTSDHHCMEATKNRVEPQAGDRLCGRLIEMAAKYQPFLAF